MAKSRSLATNLARVFDASKSIIYVVQRGMEENAGQVRSTSRVIYANDACLDWIGVDFQTLKSTPLIYSASPLPHAAENAIRGLAIPFPEPVSGNDQPPRPNLFDGNSIPGDNDNSTNHPPTTPFAIIFSEAVDDPDPERGETEQLATSSSKPTTQFRLAQLIRLGPCNKKNIDAEDWLVLASPQIFNRPPTLPDPAQPKLVNQLHAALANASTAYSKRHSLASLAGPSDTSLVVRSSVEMAIAAPRLNMAIYGPVGVGKEHLARTIVQQRHGNSRQFDFHFIDCRIADPPLIQATLNELNKLTGKQKRLDSSNLVQTPTLTLLHADHLDQACQQELIGFFRLPNFQLNTVATAERRLGDNEAFLPVLATILTSMRITLPALRDRLEDLPFLAQQMLEQYNVKAGTTSNQLSRFSNKAISLLLEYDWPNNIDELSSVVRDACKAANGSEVQVGDLPESLLHGIRAKHLEPISESTIELTAYLESIETKLVQRAMIRAKGNKTKASRLLGISRPRLLRRLRQLGLNQWLEAKEEPVEFIDVESFEEVDDE